MYSLFPELFDLSFYVPFLFRIVLGYYIVREGYRLFAIKLDQSRANEQSLFRIIGGLIFAVGFFLFIGIFVQLVAAIAVALGLVALYLRRTNSDHTPQTRGFYILATLIALSLILLGPGIFAIDIPL